MSKGINTGSLKEIKSPGLKASVSKVLKERKLEEKEYYKNKSR
jgi:hypothetical protein